MLLANELQSIRLRYHKRSVPPPATPLQSSRTFGLLGNRERPQFPQPYSPHKTFALELVESVLTNHHQVFRNVGVSPYLLPTQDLYSSTFPQTTLMLSTFRALTLITTPPLSPAPQNTLRVRSERWISGPEQRPLRGSGRAQRDQRAPLGRGRVCAAE
jgi:hypothetical protein